MTPDKKTAENLKGVAVFVAGGSQKNMRATAQQAGAKVVDELTPNVDILVGDGDNRLVQHALDLGVAVWSESDLMTATAGAPPPPPPSNNDQDAVVCKKTIFVRRYPALPGDVASDSGIAAPLAYSWMDGTSSAEIEAGLRFLFGAATDDALRLLDSRGCDVPITSAIPNGVLLTLQLVPTTPSAPPSDIPNPSICRFNVGTCTVSPRSTRRSLPAPIRSAIHKRQRDNGQWSHKPTKKCASASLVPTFETAQASHVEPPHAETKADDEQNPLDIAAHHDQASKKLASEAQALNKWAAAADDDLDADCKKEGTIEEAAPVPSEGVATRSDSASLPGIAATGKTQLRKIVDGAKVVIKMVSEKVAAVQKSSSAPTVQTASHIEAAPQSKPGTVDALRSVHKRASNWLPSRHGRSDLSTPLRSTTPA